MPNSLKCMIKKMKHKGKITEAEYAMLVTKLAGHDRIRRNNVLDEAIKNVYQESRCEFMSLHDVARILENMKVGEN